MPLSKEKIALELAADAVAGGINDLWDLFCPYDYGHLNDAEWEEVCEMAEALKPTIHVTAERCAAWARATLEIAAEKATEQRAFSLH